MKKKPAVSARNKQENKSDVEAHLFCPFDLLFELRSLHFSFLLPRPLTLALCLRAPLLGDHMTFHIHTI